MKYPAQLDRIACRIEYVAPANVRDAIRSLARTEDVRFSPTGRHLAVAGFTNNKITVFKTSISQSGGAKKILLTDVTEISSKCLNAPHGLDFIDERKIVVTNREGDVCIFDLPDTTGNHEVVPLVIFQSKEIASPGSVAVMSNGGGVCEVLICNNYIHTVTRHRLDLSAPYSINNDVFLKKRLDVPDGICVSRNRRWIAVSNHNSHSVFVYENDKSLNEVSDPAGLLRGIYYPHGLRFTSDCRFVLVTDAAAPYVNIYQNDDLEWQGVRYPFLSFRVLDNEDFLRGRHNPEEGGPKGIDIDNATNVVVVTCETQPLAFFDLDAILESACEGKLISNSNYSLSKDWRRKQKMSEISCELELQDLEKKSKAVIVEMMNSESWQITAPLRWLMAKVRMVANGRWMA